MIKDAIHYFNAIASGFVLLEGTTGPLKVHIISRFKCQVMGSLPPGATVKLLVFLTWIHQNTGLSFTCSSLNIKVSPFSKGLIGLIIGKKNSDAEAHLLHVGDQSLPVGKPFVGEGRCWRELITAELQGNLETVSMEVVEILHTFRNREITLSQHAFEMTEPTAQRVCKETINTHRKPQRNSFFST